MRRRIPPMAMEQTNARPKKEAIWYQNSLTSRGAEGELGLVRRREGGNYNGSQRRRLAVIDWLMAAAPGQRITFFEPNSGTQCPPQCNAMPPTNTTPSPIMIIPSFFFATFTFKYASACNKIVIQI